MSKILKIGKYYEMAESHKGVKKGRIYKLKDCNSREFPNDPAGESSWSFYFEDIETSKVIYLSDPPPSIIKREVDPPKSERLKQAKEKEKEKQETLQLKLPENYYSTISVSFAGTADKSENGRIFLHYKTAGKDGFSNHGEETAVYFVENFSSRIKKIVWKKV